MHFRCCVPAFLSCNFENKFEGFQVTNFLLNRGFGIHELRGSRLNPFHVTWYFRCYLISIRTEMMSNSLGSRRTTETFLEVPIKFRVWGVAENQNPGQSNLWCSEFSRVDWERGTFQSCSLFQDHGIRFSSFKEFSLSCSF